MTPSAPKSNAPAGFTLIEMLTVISIIGVLAALTLGMASAAKNARVNSRATGDLRKLQTAIEAYKADRNAYPPDHLLPAGSAQKVDPTVNQLYYELRGTEVVEGAFRPKGGGELVTTDTIRQVFGRRGFLNSTADPAEPVKSYLVDPKASDVRRIDIGGKQVDILVTPFDWPPGASVPAPLTGNRYNPWRYVSTSATNNSGSYDLWAEVYVGKQVRLFKNW